MDAILFSCKDCNMKRKDISAPNNVNNAAISNRTEKDSSESSTGTSENESVVHGYQNHFGNTELQSIVAEEPMSPLQTVLYGDIASESSGMSISGFESNTAAVQSMDTLARKSSNATRSSKNAQETIAQALALSGRSLPKALQSSLEAKYNEDLSDVRIHTGAVADGAATSIQAKAFASGTDIVFANGMYDPSTAAGKELLAHEVAHVVQHKQGRLGAGSEVVNGVSVVVPNVLVAIVLPLIKAPLDVVEPLKSVFIDSLPFEEFISNTPLPLFIVQVTD